MANTVNGILTTEGKTALVGITYLATTPPSSSNALARIYTFLGKTDPWPDETAPKIATQTTKDYKTVSKNYFAAKKVTASTISPVVPRYDWTSGQIYSKYTDYQNILTYDVNGIMNNVFYVRNRYDQIFKCLFNNNNAPSTVEPVIQPGFINIQDAITLADKYKWIYVQTIDKGLKRLFFDNQWMPVVFDRFPPNTLSAAKLGAINAINVTANGSNYINGLTTTTVTITGDGVNAAAYANAYNSIIQDVIMTNAGNNYTYATVTINSTSANGSGAAANATNVPFP